MLMNQALSKEIFMYYFIYNHHARHRLLSPFYQCGSSCTVCASPTITTIYGYSTQIHLLPKPSPLTTFLLLYSSVTDDLLDSREIVVLGTLEKPQCIQVMYNN